MTSAKKQLRVGIVGTGFGQHAHVPAFRSNGRCRVSAICATSLERAQLAADALGVEKPYGNWLEMVRDADIDVISIAAPAAFQPEIALESLRLNKHVFCEKPLSSSLEAAATVARAAKEAGVANMINFEFPEIAEWKRAKEILGSGVLGNLRHASYTWHIENYANKPESPPDSWKVRTESGGGALNIFASHALYHVEWFLGPIKSLCARLACPPGGGQSADSIANLWLTLESGLAVSLSVSACSFPGTGHRLEFFGDQGSLVLDNGNLSDYINGFELFLATRQSNRLEKLPVESRLDPSSPDGRVLTVASMVNRFVSWIDTGRPDKPSLSEGLRVQQLIEAARQSDRDGVWVGCQPAVE